MADLIWLGTSLCLGYVAYLMMRGLNFMTPDPDVKKSTVISVMLVGFLTLSIVSEMRGFRSPVFSASPENPREYLPEYAFHALLFAYFAGGTIFQLRHGNEGKSKRDDKGKEE